MKALPKILLALTAVAALSVVYPASVQAVPTTYQYTGNPFTTADFPYTTSDYVTVMMTLAEPLPSNFHGDVTPTAFTISDGVQTFTNTTPDFHTFLNFVTNDRGEITFWTVVAENDFLPEISIITVNIPGNVIDGASTLDPEGQAGNRDTPGEWGPGNATPD